MKEKMFWTFVLVTLVLLVIDFCLKDAAKQRSVKIAGPPSVPVLGNAYLYWNRRPDGMFWEI